MLEASGVTSDLSQSKNTMYGPGVQTTAGAGASATGGGVYAGSAGAATGSGIGSGAPKLNVRPPRMLCERKRPLTSAPLAATRATPGALKKRYFSDTSTLSDSGARTPAIACQATTVSESSTM